MKQCDFMNLSLTDLHTHILPFVDDGATDVTMSVEILCSQKSKGIDRVALTPHYYPLQETLDVFLARRQEAYTMLLSCYDKNTMPQLCLGAEVRYTPKLVELDLRQLTIGSGSYLLLELPDMGTPPLLEQIVDFMLLQGITPVLAHIERCDFFRNEPEELLKFAQRGVLAQISASAIAGRVDDFALACLKNGLAHVISSDVHRVSDLAVLSSLNKYRDFLQWSESFAKAIWEDSPLPAYSIAPVKRSLFGYR